MRDVEVLGYLAAALHAVAPDTEGPGASRFTNPKRLTEALSRLTREQKELVVRVFDGMVRERAEAIGR